MDGLMARQADRANQIERHGLTGGLRCPRAARSGSLGPMSQPGHDDTPVLVLKLRGRPAVFSGRGTRLRFPTRKALALFICLARAGAAGAARDRLAELLWPDRPDADSRRALRGTLHEMRRALGAEAGRLLRQTRERVALAPDLIATDAEDVDAAPAGPKDQATDFLVGLEIGTPGFDQWCAEERARLHEAALRAAADRMEAALAAGRFAAAQAAAERLRALDPLSEAGCRGLMRALSGLGRRADALRCHAAFRDRLAEELDTAPEGATDRLAAHVRQADVRLPRAALPRPDRPSLVVMPLADMTGGSQAHMVDGLTADIRTGLARDRALFVVAGESAEAYRGTALGAAEIAGELGVRYLIGGRVRLDEDRLRLDVELTDGLRNTVVWSARYDRPRGAILSVQDEVVGEVVATLRGYKGVLQRNEARSAEAASPGELSAHDHMMRGMLLKEKFLKHEMRAARDHFETALALAPGSAAAHGWLAWTWFFEVYLGWADDTAEALARTRAHAEAAVEGDPDLDFAHWALGAAHLGEGDNAGALACFDRALALNPNNSDALANCAWPLMFEGRADEAVARLRQAMRLNPFYPDWYLWGLGMAEYLRGDFAAACDALGRMAQPNAQSLAFHVAALRQMGEPSRAHALARGLHALAPGSTAADLVAPLGFRESGVRDRLTEALRAAGMPG